MTSTSPPLAGAAPGAAPRAGSGAEPGAESGAVDGRGGRSWLSTCLGPIRVRLALIVLIAAVPLLMLSAIIALENYHLALGETAVTAKKLRAEAVARHAAAIGGARQMMQALAQVGPLTDGSPAACHDILAGLLALQAARLTTVSVSNAAGQLRCTARALPDAGMPRAAVPSDSALFALARTRRDFVLGPIRASSITGQQIIPLVYPIMRGDLLYGYIYAGLRLDWFAHEAAKAGSPFSAAWIVDGHGDLTQLGATPASGLPPPAVLDRLEQTAHVVGARSAAGEPYVYASALLGDGYSLIVADPAANDQVLARNLLLRRIFQLGLLLLLGLAAVAVGVHVALARPLSQLSQAVAGWRIDGRFSPGPWHNPPTELRDLAASFAEAVASLAEHAARHRGAIAQQELLMKEIHHRVKNNLQIVASLLNLQAARIRLPEARAEFASARDRVRALATLHRHLYAQGEVHTINMPVFLTELCDQLFQAMGETAGTRITLDIAASPLQMSSDQAVPLSLIVTEAVSNALKYAFPGGRRGHVTVRLGVTGEMADLVIEDDGIGIPAGRTETETGPRDGIGITLIRGFARQLGATLTVSEENGTRYSLHIPLNHEADPVEIAA